MSLGLCMFTELIMSLLNYLSSLSYNKNKECSIPEWAMPPEIRTTFHALRGRTWQWVYWMVLPQCTSARGRKNLPALVFSAAEFFINIFSEVWMKQSDNAKKIPKEEKSIKYWKDIIFILVLLLLLLLLLSTVSASVTQEISRHVNKEVKIDSISITRPSLADIFLIFISFSALGY